MILSILLLFASVVGIFGENYDCHSRDYGNGGTVCVCDSGYCDVIEPYSKEEGKYILYTSSKAGDRFRKSVGDFVQNFNADNRVLLNRTRLYQKLIGFGGAFTDSTGININALNEQAAEYLLRSYYSTDGIEYNFGRVPIGGTDFSTHGYSYLDNDTSNARTDSYTLANEDFLYKIPLIKKALTIRNGDLELFASAWIAPKWMKSNNAYNGWSSLKDEYFQAWADYQIKFLDLYKENGIEFWGISTGNEPSLSLLPFNKIPSVGFGLGLEKQVKWVTKNLGPTLKNSQYSHLKVLALDDQRFMVKILENELKNTDFKQYIDGVGIHWYWNSIFPISWVDSLHKNNPDLFLMGTEACKGSGAFEEAVSLGSWARGEEYANDIIENLQHGYSGWVDWNMALDLTGGPTYISNNVDSPIIVNATAGEFYKQPMFYAMGHFSKFLTKDSIRIDLNKKLRDLKLVAFLRPDGATVVVIFNRGDKTTPLKIQDSILNRVIDLNIAAKSINTLLYWK